MAVDLFETDHHHPPVGVERQNFHVVQAGDQWPFPRNALSSVLAQFHAGHIALHLVVQRAMHGDGAICARAEDAPLFGLARLVGSEDGADQHDAFEIL